LKTHSPDKATLIARCRLKQAKEWFAIRGWEQLPQDERGWSVLRWGADHAWMAASGNPQTSVRRWCRKAALWLTVSELDELVDETKRSNKRWSPDQCAAVLEISVTDRMEHKLWHFGAYDDPNYEVRLGISRTKSAKRSRKYRAKHSTGAKRGRPRLQLSPEEALARRRAQDAERQRRRRASRKKPSRDILDIDGVTEFSVTGHSGVDRGAPETPPPPHAVPDDGLILDEDGHEFTPPPPYQRRPAPKTWMDAAFEGYNGGRS
jgi:hypothetical protein